MKKIFSLALLAAIAMFSIVSCGDDDNKTEYITLYHVTISADDSLVASLENAHQYNLKYAMQKAAETTVADYDVQKTLNSARQQSIYWLQQMSRSTMDAVYNAGIILTITAHADGHTDQSITVVPADWYQAAETKDYAVEWEASADSMMFSQDARQALELTAQQLRAKYPTFRTNLTSVMNDFEAQRDSFAVTLNANCSADVKDELTAAEKKYYWHVMGTVMDGESSLARVSLGHADIVK